MYRSTHFFNVRLLEIRSNHYVQIVQAGQTYKMDMFQKDFLMKNLVLRDHLFYLGLECQNIHYEL